MSRNYNRRASLVPALKVSVVAVGLVLAGSAQAISLKFDNGITGSFDTTMSYGVSIRTKDAAADLIGIANGGTSRSVNEDDGDRNYKKGKPFSNLFKVSHELELKSNDWGLFVRGLYFIDFENNHKDTLGPEAKDRVGQDARILDAFVTKSFAVGDRNIKTRWGQQVISWGESTFIPNSINSINAVDLSKLRVPGSELKDGLIPTASVWGSMELTNNASVEAYYLLNFDKTRLDPRGTYWSSNDYVTPDGNQVFLSFGRRHDLSYGKGPGNPIPPTSTAFPTTQLLGYGPFDAAASVWAPRGPDQTPSDHGQYGLAFRYLAPMLNNTEFGFYFEKYHSRTPYVSGFKGNPTSLLTSGPLGANPAINQNGTASYFIEYPENIRLYGMSFNTQGPAGIALQGEVSYRPNQPLAYSGVEVLLAALGLPNQLTGDAIIPATISQAPPYGVSAARLVPDGTLLRGWERVKMMQMQMTATKSIPNFLGSDQGVFVVEAGRTQYTGLRSDVYFNGPGVNLPVTFNGANGFSQAGSQQPGGFVTKSSWGYRLAARMDYSNLVLGANVSPRLAFSHDVSGVSQTFNEGVKSLSVGANFDWQKRWALDLSYTGYSGGRVFCGTDTVTSAAAQSSLAAQIAGVPALGIAPQGANWCSSTNPLHDRSFYSVVVSYSF